MKSLILFSSLTCMFSLNLNANIVEDAQRKLAGWDTIRFKNNQKTSTNSKKKYMIYFRKGSEKNKLIVHFSGGGICWDYDSVNSPITMQKAIDLETKGKEILTGCKQDFWHPMIPMGLDGIFSKKDKNPFKNWNAIFITYVSGDFHIGKNINREYTSKDGSKKNRISHNGYNNVKASLEWITRKFPSPKKILVSGDSAGAMASVYWARKFSESYPNSKIYQLSDGMSMKAKGLSSSIYKKSHNVDIKKEFNVSLDDNIAKAAFLSYLQPENHNPNLKLLHANTLYDDVLSGFYATITNRPKSETTKKEWSDTLVETTKSLRDSELNYEFFISKHGLNERGYTAHTSVLGERFFTNEQDGISLKDWLVDNVIFDKDYSVGNGLLVK